MSCVAQTTITLIQITITSLDPQMPRSVESVLSVFRNDSLVTITELEFSA